MSDSPFADFAAGAAIVREGEPARAMYILESGRVEIRSSLFPQPLAELGPGEVIGEMALLQEQPHSATATASTAVRALRIDQAAFYAVLRENPEVAVHLMRQLVMRLRAAEKRAGAGPARPSASRKAAAAKPAAAKPAAAGDVPTPVPGKSAAGGAPAGSGPAGAGAAVGEGFTAGQGPPYGGAAEGGAAPQPAPAAATPVDTVEDPPPAVAAPVQAAPAPSSPPDAAPIAAPASESAAPPVPEPVAPPAGEAVTPPAPAPVVAAAAPAAAWLIRHAQGDIELGAQREEWLVGRPDPATGQAPEVDLGGLDVARSLSRRHARLRREGGALVLREEPGVANGTWVNGERLAAGAAVAVKPGDRLRFGAVEVEVVAP